MMNFRSRSLLHDFTGWTHRKLCSNLPSESYQGGAAFAGNDWAAVSPFITSIFGGTRLQARARTFQEVSEREVKLASG